MTGQHASLSPSGAKDWANPERCILPYAIQSDRPDHGSEAAHMGTALHYILELAAKDYKVRARVEQRDWPRNTRVNYMGGDEFRVSVGAPNPDDIVWSVPINRKEMREALAVSLAAHDRLIALHAECSGVNVAYEARVYPLPGADDIMHGTADLIISCTQCRELVVGDYKAGLWPVDAKGNPQLMTYALGALRAVPWVPTRVYLAIIAPRMGRADVLDVAEMTLHDRGAHREALQEAVLYWREVVRSTRGDTTRERIDSVQWAALPVPDQCQWCRLRPDCNHSAGLRRFI